MTGFAAPMFDFAPIKLGGIDPVQENGAGKVYDTSRYAYDRDTGR